MRTVRWVSAGPRPRGWFGGERGARGRGPPVLLDAEAGERDDGRARVRARHLVDRGVGMERTDGFTPGVPGCAEGGKLRVVPCGFVCGPPVSDLLIPALGISGAADTDMRAPYSGLSSGVHRNLLDCCYSYGVWLVVPTT
jgi:hypothetical protein